MPNKEPPKPKVKIKQGHSMSNGIVAGPSSKKPPKAKKKAY